MKKFIISFTMILLAILTLTSCGNNVTKHIIFDENSESLKITRGGEYVLSGKLINGKIEVDAKKEVRLILSGLTVENSKEEALEIDNKSKTTIVTEKGTKNYLTGADEAAISSNSEIEFCGEGELAITGTDKHAIECEGNITINGGKYEINAYEHGIKSESIIKILLGDISVVSETGKGIKAEKEYIGDGGNITIYTKLDEGLESKGALTINGGNYDITAYDDAINAGTSDSNKTEEEKAFEEFSKDFGGKTPVHPEGFNEDAPIPNDRFNGEVPTPPEGFKGEFTPGNKPGRNNGDGFEVPPTDFTVPEGATVSGRGVPFSHEGKPGFGKINSDSVITINGGTIKIKTFGEGDGIDSNGSLSINGGTVIIDGPKQYDNGSLDSDGEMIINNASVLTVSSKGMTQYPGSMTQHKLIVDFDEVLEEGTVIIIKDEEQNIIIEHAVGVICERLYYTSPEVKENAVYTVFVNDEEVTSVTSDNSENFGDFGNFGGRGPKAEGGFAPFEQKDANKEN